MFEQEIDAISDREWEDALDAHLAWGEHWHGDLPADVFFGVWATLAGQAKPLTVHVELATTYGNCSCGQPAYGSRQCHRT